MPSSSSVSAPFSLALDLCVETEDASDTVELLIPKPPTDACDADEGAGDAGGFSSTMGF